MKKIIHLLAAIVLFAGAGCAGGTGASGSSSRGDPAVGEQDPAPANPFGTPGGGTEVETTEDEGAPPVAAAPQQTRTTQADDDTLRPRCFSRDLPDGEVGESYSYTLEAESGSGVFAYSLDSGELPAGLALSEDGVISGTPTEAAESSARVTVTDAESGKTKNCSVDITIKGELVLTKEVWGDDTKNGWDVVYKVTASEGFDDLTWTGKGLTNNVCASGAAPNIENKDFRDDCTPGTVNATGNVVYVWLQEDLHNGAPVSVMLIASSPQATDDVTLTLSFTYSPAPRCGNNTIEEGEQCDGNAVTPGYTCIDCRETTRNPVDAQSVKVTLWTGDAGTNSDTDCPVKIKFCKEKQMSTCTDEVSLDDTDDGDDREDGEENIYDDDDHLNPATLGGLTDEHRYFQLSLVDEDCGDDTENWLLQGIKVEITYQDESDYQYFNPCTEKWTLPGDTLPFGPNDTAVCAIIVTASGEYTGTDSRVSLVFDNVEHNLSNRDGIVETRLDYWSSHFTTVEGNMALDMYWGGDDLSDEYYDCCDDFESSDDASYGDYLFDTWPFTSAPTFFIRKEKDGSEDEGWKLSTAEVFVFRPGKFLNDPSDNEPTVYHNSRKDFDEWLDNETKDTYSSSRTLKAVPKDQFSTIITPAIGQEWED